MPNPGTLRFAMNHMVAPKLSAEAFFALSAGLGCTEVEIRNNLKGTAILVLVGHHDRIGNCAEVAEFLAAGVSAPVRLNPSRHRCIPQGPDRGQPEPG